jgi:hypothetical protein
VINSSSISDLICKFYLEKQVIGISLMKKIMIHCSSIPGYSLGDGDKERTLTNMRQQQFAKGM